MATQQEYLKQRIEQLEAVCHRVLAAQVADQQSALDHVLKIMRMNTSLVLEAMQAECRTMREAVGKLVECQRPEDHPDLEALKKETDALRGELAALREANRGLEQQMAELLPPCPDPAAHQPPPAEASDGILTAGPTEASDG